MDPSDGVYSLGIGLAGPNRHWIEIDSVGLPSRVLSSARNVGMDGLLADG